MKTLDEIEQELKQKADSGAAEDKARLDEFLLKRATLKRCDDATRLYRMLMLFVNEEVIDATQAQRLLKIVKEDPSKLLQIQQKLAAHMAVKDGAPNS